MAIYVTHGIAARLIINSSNLREVFSTWLDQNSFQSSRTPVLFKAFMKLIFISSLLMTVDLASIVTARPPARDESNLAPDRSVGKSIAAHSSIDAVAIYNSLMNAKSNPMHPKYFSTPGRKKPDVTIYAGPAEQRYDKEHRPPRYFFSNMDIDCDGVYVSAFAGCIRPSYYCWHKV
jgi:hypothetical protein